MEIFREGYLERFDLDNMALRDSIEMQEDFSIDGHLKRFRGDIPGNHRVSRFVKHGIIQVPLQNLETGMYDDVAIFLSENFRNGYYNAWFSKEKLNISRWHPPKFNNHINIGDISGLAIFSNQNPDHLRGHVNSVIESLNDDYIISDRLGYFNREVKMGSGKSGYVMLMNSIMLGYKKR